MSGEARSDRVDVRSELSDGASGRLAQAVLFGLIVAPLGFVWLPLGMIGAGLAMFGLVGGIRRADEPAVRVATLTTLMIGAALLGLPFAVWFAVGAMVMLSRFFGILVPRSGWLPIGSLTPLAISLTGLTVVIAAIGLTSWAIWAEEFGAATVELVDLARRLPGVVLVLGIVVFVVFNALAEELAYRGVVFEAAAGQFRPAAAVFLQAAAFGTLHIAGFPGGLVGVGLTFVYGLALGAVRHLTDGLRLALIAHMAADATIALVVLTIVIPRLS